MCLLYALITVLMLASCLKGSSREQYHSRTQFAMNTLCTVILYGEANPDVHTAVFARIDEIESRMNNFLPDSDISRINAAAGIQPITVHEEVFFMIKRAKYFAEISGGAFDPTIGPLVSLWGVTTENPSVPESGEINNALSFINWNDITLDEEALTVFLNRRGMSLDLGAIAKGYAADEAVALIKAAGVDRAIVDLGGNVFTVGMKDVQTQTPWNVGLRNPFQGKSPHIGIISGGDITVVTSGVDQRYFEEGGVRYHHLFSPFDGYPAQNGLVSVTVTAAVSADADALSTAAFVLGYEKGSALIESYDGAEAIFVFDDKSIRKTSGASFVLRDETFHLVSDEGSLPKVSFALFPFAQQHL